MSTVECPYCGAALNQSDTFCAHCERRIPPNQGSVSRARREKPYRIVPAPRSSEQEPERTAGAFPRYSQPAPVPEPAFSGAGAPDPPTVIIGDDDPDADSPTYAIDTGPSVYLVRKSTGEKIGLLLPAVVGKGSAATARIGGNNAISRAHLGVDELDEGYAVEDLGSTNKTSINDVRIKPGEKVFVRSGDVIRLADEAFEFIVEQ